MYGPFVILSLSDKDRRRTSTIELSAAFPKEKELIFVKNSNYRSDNGSISTRMAVWGISLASQKESAPLRSLVMTERFGDLSKNWKRCSFLRRASGAEAGPRIRMPFPSEGKKYSERRRDKRIAFSRFASRTITLASEVNGGYAIMRRKCSSRS